jgi:hypothetical protein
MMKYQYLWNEKKDSEGRHPSLWDGYQPGDPLCLAWEGDTGMNGTDAELCEDLFHLFNAPGARPEGYRGPSMSVGSVVVLGDLAHVSNVAYAVDRVGFKQVDITASPIVDAPKEWTK